MSFQHPKEHKSHLSEASDSDTIIRRTHSQSNLAKLPSHDLMGLTLHPIDIDNPPGDAAAPEPPQAAPPLPPPEKPPSAVPTVDGDKATDLSLNSNTSKGIEVKFTKMAS